MTISVQLHNGSYPFELHIAKSPHLAEITARNALSPNSNRISAIRGINGEFSSQLYANLSKGKKKRGDLHEKEVIGVNF